MENGTRTASHLREGVAEEVRALLARRRLAAGKLAQAIGKSEMYVSRRLRGETAFDVDDLQAIAGVLEVTVLELLPTSARTPVPAIPAATTERKSRQAERTTSGQRRPADNRPSGQPSSDHSSGVRRTARVPRAGRS